MVLSDYGDYEGVVRLGQITAGSDRLEEIRARRFKFIDRAVQKARAELAENSEQEKQMTETKQEPTAAALLNEPSNKEGVSDHQVRERAYYIWVSKGCPIDTTAMDDWLEAERVARGED
jgi:hypothetical protein